MRDPHFSLAKQIVTTLRSAGYTALFAGGWVRDHLMNRQSQDIDIATDAHPEQVCALFEQSITVGAQFGVVRVRMGAHEFEIATFRSDTQYIDGRHPEHIELKGSAREDCQRRDFTINGMYFDPIAETVYDFVGGKKDIEQKLIRTIGEAKRRFQEDRLRILRAIRFKNSLQFTIEPKTWEALCQQSPHVIEDVSPERIWQELSKMQEKHILGPCLQDFSQTPLLNSLFPSLLLSKEELASRLHHIEQATNSPLVAALCLLITERQSLCFFHLSNKEEQIINTFTALEKLASRPSDEQIVQTFSLPHINESLQAWSLTRERTSYNFCLQKADELHFWIDQLKNKRFFVTGQDLLNHGYTAGKALGEAIRKAFTISLQERLTDKPTILQRTLDEQRPIS